VEQLFFQRNVSTAISVGQARGVAILVLAQAGLPVREYSPQEVKQAIVGYGGADKRQVQEMIRVLLGLEAIPKPDDAADALAVAVCHLHSSQLRQRLERAE
jgi:crossover junction endodeoxyribonuclease RuvC